GEAGRRPAVGPDVRDHRHARVVDARGGREGARGAGREGLELGVEEDRGTDRRRGAWFEIEEGAGRSRPRPRPKSPAKTTVGLEQSRTGPGRSGPSRPRAPARSG